MHMLLTRSNHSQYNPRTNFNRGLTAQTGFIPEGVQLLQDVWPLKIVDTKQVIGEGIAGGAPVTRMTGIFQIADDMNANGRVYPRPVVKEAVEAIQEDLANRSVWGEFDHPCLNTPDFRVLCEDGWKEFRDIKVGDMVWSRVNGKAVLSEVNTIIDEPYTGPAYHFKNKSIDATFTGGHRFVLQTRSDRNRKSEQIYRTAQDIFVNQANYSHDSIPKTAKWEDNSKDIFVLPGVDVAGKEDDITINAVDFSSLIGIYLAEGYIKTKWTAVICQKNKEGRQLISKLLSRLPFEWHEIETGFAIADARFAAYVEPLGDKYTKFIPHDIKLLGHDCLASLIHWFCIGDGRLVKSKPKRALKESWDFNPDISLGGCGMATATMPYTRSEVFCTSKRLIDDLHECLVRSGGCGTLSIIRQKDRLINGRVIRVEHTKPLYQLYISKFHNIYLKPETMQIKEIHHTGNIYCLGVTHSNFYIEINGKSFWTGNCDAKIHLDRISHLLTKVWMEGKNVYGEAEIMDDLPFGRQLKSLMQRGRIGISSRGIGDMDVRDHGGQETYYVTEGYRFVTWDAVAEPSVSGAILHICEGKLKPLKKTVHNVSGSTFTTEAYQKRLVKEISEYLSKK